MLTAKTDQTGLMRRLIFRWKHMPFCWFVCVEVLRPSQPNGVMSSAVSLPNHTFTGQAQSSKQLTSILHILSPKTDNCPSWISRRERMTVENISWSISMKECCRPRRGVKPTTSWSPVGHTSNWATEAGFCWLCHTLAHIVNVLKIGTLFHTFWAPFYAVIS